MSIIKSAPAILIVDGHERSMRLIREALTTAGFNPLCVTTGALALDLLESRGGAVVRVVIIDLATPDIDGMDLVARVGILRADIKILVILDYADGIVVHGEFSNPNVDFLGKPFDVRDLCARVKIMLG